MQIIHNSQSTFSLSRIRGGRKSSDVLQSSERELLNQMSSAFTLIHGGHFKSKRHSA